MQFMDADSACLVPYTLVPVSDPEGPYVGAQSHWAEPDVPAAAALLKRLLADAGERTRIGAKAATRAAVLDHGYDRERYSEAFLAAL